MIIWPDLLDVYKQNYRYSHWYIFVYSQNSWVLITKLTNITTTQKGILIYPNVFFRFVQFTTRNWVYFGQLQSKKFVSRLLKSKYAKISFNIEYFQSPRAGRVHQRYAFLTMILISSIVWNIYAKLIVLITINISLWFNIVNESTKYSR